jgi:hypothetical protein
VLAAAVSNDATFVRKGDIAMVQLDGNWTSAALGVSAKPGAEACRDMFHSRSGRAPRLLGMFRDTARRR